MIFELPGEYDVHVSLEVHRLDVTEITMVRKIQPCRLYPEIQRQARVSY